MLEVMSVSVFYRDYVKRIIDFAIARPVLFVVVTILMPITVAVDK